MTALRDVVEERWTALASGSPVAGRALRTSPLPVDTPYGPLSVAIDRAGGRHLLVPLAPRQTLDTDLGSRAVRLVTRPLEDAESYRIYADLALVDVALADAFTSLCEDVLVAVTRRPDRAVRALLQVLSAWRALLADGRGPVGAEALAGLYAELLVLERLLQRDPGSAATWHGPTGSAQDFHRGAEAIEVKATTRPEGRVITVHGLDQLVEPTGGTLMLVWFRLARGSTVGTSVPEQIDRVLDLADDPALVRRGLSLLGYRDADRAEYADIRFRVREERAFEVTPGFPRMTKDHLVGDALVGGVLDVIYRVDLDSAAVRARRVEDHVGRFLGEEFR